LAGAWLRSIVNENRELVMFEFTGDTVDEIFVAALTSVLEHGEAISPRGIETREIFPAAFELRNPRARVLLVEGRYINPAYAIAEALWIISGSEEAWIFEYNSKLKEYANDGILKGAYGPRLRTWAGQIDQLDKARYLLKKDRATRRAIIQLYDPMSVEENHLDIPCTITHHFLIRRGRLHLFTTMRGQDVWLGLPYDIFYNTLLHEFMAGWVGVELGSYYYRADSLHIYSHDISSAKLIRQNASQCHRSMPPLLLDWQNRDAVIAAVLSGHISGDDALAPLAKTLEGYRSWKIGLRSKALDLAASVDGPLGEGTSRWYRHLSSLSVRSSALA
jgi:thymidylate synthase